MRRALQAVLLLRIQISLVLMFFIAAPLTIEAQEKRIVRMVFVSLAWNSELPFRVALARGFFKAQGVQIEPILIRGGPAAIAALTSGEVDFASIGGAQAVFRGKARGLDLTIVGCISSTTNYILRPPSAVTTSPGGTCACAGAQRAAGRAGRPGIPARS